MSTTKDVLNCYKENAAIYKKLLEDMKRERVVPFIGAGISAKYYPTWNMFLTECIKGEGKKHEDTMAKMLAEHHYEEAASYIQEVLGEMRFRDRMQSAFSDEKLEGADVTITLQLICLLFRQTVITTNFDHVLKWAYEKMGNSFVEQVTPRRKLDAPAIDRIWRQHSLIKLHGSISREEDIVLTKEEYDLIYGKSSLLKTPFTKLLRNIYTNNVLLFLGCSLNADRTMMVLENILEKEKRDQYHYAFMELPKETENAINPYEPIIYEAENKLEEMAELERRLSNLRIRVIWFPYRKYEAIDILLDELCKDLKKKL